MGNFVIVKMMRHFLLNVEVSLRTLIILSGFRYIALVMCDLCKQERLGPVLVRSLRNGLSPPHNSEMAKAI